MRIVKNIIITTVASLIIGIGLFVLFPKCFYSKIGLVSSGNDGGTEYVEVNKSAEISFVCQQRYIDSVILYVYECAPNTCLDIIITDSKGRKKYQANEIINSNMFVTLPVKRTFSLNETFNLSILNGTDTSVKLKISTDLGPTEEIKTCVDDKIREDKIYASFLYGLYSKKYLALVYVLLWCGCYVLIASCEIRLSKKIEKKKQ